MIMVHALILLIVRQTNMDNHLMSHSSDCFSIPDNDLERKFGREIYQATFRSK